MPAADSVSWLGGVTIIKYNAFFSACSVSKRALSIPVTSTRVSLAPVSMLADCMFFQAAFIHGVDTSFVRVSLGSLSRLRFSWPPCVLGFGSLLMEGDPACAATCNTGLPLCGLTAV